MSELVRAISLAYAAHEGQTDKNGQPYILHPLRVMMACGEADERVAIAAILHDVIEDNKYGYAPDDLSTSYEFDWDIVAAVDALTRRDGEHYFSYVRRAGANRIARVVKMADLRDNLRPGAPHLREKYENALSILQEQA